MRNEKQTPKWVFNSCLGIMGMFCLAACANAPPAGVLTKTQVERIIVPASLLTINAEPTVPSSRMQSAAAAYIVHLKINDDECHSDVAAIAVRQQ